MVYYSRTNPDWKPRLWPFFVWALATIAIGVYILLDTHEFARILAFAFAFYLIISGTINLLIFFRMTGRDSAAVMHLWQGILRLMVGFLALLLPVIFVSITWITIIYLIAVQFLVSAVVDWSLSWRVVRTGYPLGVQPSQHIGSGVLSFLIAVVLFLAPRMIGIGLLRLIAGGMILLGVVFLLIFIRSWWLTRNNRSGLTSV
jgi:uncharacterized membrane protein HdeD (DUF308 family)